MMIEGKSFLLGVKIEVCEALLVEYILRVDTFECDVNGHTSERLRVSGEVMQHERGRVLTLRKGSEERHSGIAH